MLTGVRSIRQYGYVPFGVLDPSSVGRQTREGSRTLEVRRCACGAYGRTDPFATVRV